MGEVLVKLSGVTKKFPGGIAPALRSVSGTIEGGQITGLVGPDGAGKTTLIRLMNGLMVPDEGSLEVLGYDTRRESEHIHAAIGYMPQRFGLYEDLTVLENLHLYAELRALPPEERSARQAELLQFTDLARFSSRLARNLSGGMKQKLGLACALLRKPRLLLLDEPSVGVDPISRRELWRMVSGLKDEGTGVVWSTAYLDEAEGCDRVLLLNEGQLLFDGAPSDLTARTEGRVYRLTGVADRRRAVLVDVLAADGVIDGVIQGEAIRFVMKAGAGAPLLPSHAGTEATITPTRPRLEDSFIDALGGGPGGHSRLADAMPQRPTTEGPVIVAHKLTKRFGDFTAASEISFEIKQGEIFGLLGPNGAGKSTTFRMLCGLLKPSDGQGRVAGRDLRTDVAEARAQLGYMAQKFSLYGDLNVRQNLDFFAGAYGLSGKRKRSRTELMTEVFELERYLSSPARDLPLGYKQRLALACAVVHEPPALFLDEPTSGVDPITRREFWAHIHGMVEKGVTVLVTTHFMDEAEYCDRISLIYRGRSIALGSPDELKAKVATDARPDPTMEDAFIALIEASGEDRAES
jgi:ABC-2 type transport system ATP-binding protein